MTTRKTVDWAAVEADFRAGRLSNRQIAKRHDVSEAAIRKRAGAAGWVRTPRTDVDRVPTAEILPPAARPLLPMPDGADHRDMGRNLALRMLHELDATTSHLGDLEAAIVEETADDVNARRRDAMLKALSLPVRAHTLKTIAQALGAMADAATGPKGKKEQRQEAAAAAAQGRFAPPAPPKLVVDNG